MKKSSKIFDKIIKPIFSYFLDLIIWIIATGIVILIFQYTPITLIEILGSIVITIIIALIIYCIIWSINRQKEIEKIIDLIKVESRYRPRIKKKISRIFKYLNEIRSYRRQVKGIRDFTPLVKRHRYITPSKELIEKIDKLEKNIINNITKNPTEETVEQNLSTVTQIHKNLINKLNKVK